jgi:hypothetical protein
MKLAARIATALAVLGLAVPALACEDMKPTKTATSKDKTAVAKAEKKPTTKGKTEVKKVN